MKTCKCGRGSIASPKNYRCKDCNRERTQARYHANPEHMRQICYEYRRRNPEVYKAHNARYRLKLKIDVLTHYGNGKPECWCCGEDIIQFLGLDHMDNDGAKERQVIGGGHSTYRWLKSNGYPERNFKVACQNCNSTRYYYGICPHQQMVVADDPIAYLGAHYADN